MCGELEATRRELHDSRQERDGVMDLQDETVSPVVWCYVPARSPLGHRAGVGVARAPLALTRCGVAAGCR